MAFGFLDDLFGGAETSGLGNVIKTGASLYDLFRSHKSKSADEMSALLGAAVDPNSPRFRNLAALFEEKSKADALQGIQRQMQQQARAKARGDVGFGINPERRDEARSGAIAQAFMDAGRMGTDQAYNALTGTAGQYAPLVGYDERQDAGKSQRIGAGVEGLAGIFDAFQNKQPPASSVSRNPYDIYQDQYRRAMPVTEF